jgi:multiple sugar transport system substrate-binding protein
MKPMKRLSLLFVFALLFVVALPALAQESISVWIHSGQGEEREQFEALIAEYNESQDAYEAVLEVVPEGSYNDQVRAAALAGDLPCVLDFDGPFIYNYVFAGDLIPLDPFVSEELMDDVLPSIIDQGTVDDQLWSLGQFDSGIAFWGNRALLEEAGVRIPEGINDTWTLDELNAAFEALAEVVPEDGRVVEFFMDRTGEWYSYAFGPMLRSFGGDTIDKESFDTAEGVLNGPEAVDFGEWLQGVFEAGYATATPVDPSADFQNGLVALAYDGHWNYNPYSEALGDDLVLIPMPDFGEGAVSGMGSWNWGITSTCDNQEGAWDFIEFMMQPEQVTAVTQANGAPPALVSLLNEDERYAEGGDMYIYTQQLQEGVAVPRAATAAYPGIQTAMSDLIQALARGEDVQDALDKAVDTADAAIEALE